MIVDQRPGQGLTIKPPEFLDHNPTGWESDRGERRLYFSDICTNVSDILEPTEALCQLGLGANERWNIKAERYQEDRS